LTQTPKLCYTREVEKQKAPAFSPILRKLLGMEMNLFSGFRVDL